MPDMHVLVVYVSSRAGAKDTKPLARTHPPAQATCSPTSQPQNISNQTKINRRGHSLLRPVHSAPPHSSPACRLRKCPSRIPTARGRVMTRPGQPSPPSNRPCLRERGLESSPPARRPGSFGWAAGEEGPQA